MIEIKPQTQLSQRQWVFRSNSSIVAFSLIEVLVGIAVTFILGAVLMIVWNSTVAIWQESQSRVVSAREGQTTIHLLQQELRSICVNFDKRFFQLPLENEKERNGKYSSLGFVTRIPTSAQPDQNQSEMCAIAYYVAYGPKVDGVFKSGKTMHLYRAVRYGADTVKAIIGADSLFLDTTLPLANSEVLVRNVADFQINAFSVGEEGGVRPFVQTMANPVPDFLEIKLTVLNPSQAKQLSSEAEWTHLDVTAMQRFSQTFTLNVALNKYH